MNVFGFNPHLWLFLGYHDVVTIPRGSVNIFVEELEMSTDNYIGMSLFLSGAILDGLYKIIFNVSLSTISSAKRGQRGIHQRWVDY